MPLVLDKQEGIDVDSLYKMFRYIVIKISFYLKALQMESLQQYLKAGITVLKFWMIVVIASQMASHFGP